MITRTDPRHDSVLTCRNDNNQLHSTIQLQQDITNEYNNQQSTKYNKHQATKKNSSTKNAKGLFQQTNKKYKNTIPSRGLTYPTLGKGKSSSKSHFCGDMLVPWRVSSPWIFQNFRPLSNWGGTPPLHLSSGRCRCPTLRSRRLSPGDLIRAS